jgi:hypothetical protein
MFGSVAAGAVRVVVALIVASCAVAAFFYLVPSLRLWRGIEAIAVIVVACGTFAILNRRRNP